MRKKKYSHFFSAAKKKQPRCKVTVLPPSKKIETGRTLYGNIGVKRTASDDKIRRGIRRAFKKLHPDKTNFDGENKYLAELGWNCIERTRDILCDVERKEKYDAVLDALKPHGGAFVDFVALEKEMDSLWKMNKKKC